MRINKFIVFVGHIIAILLLLVANITDSPQISIISLTILLIALVVFCLQDFDGKLGLSLYFVSMVIFLCARPIIFFWTRDENWMCGFFSGEFIPAINAIFLSFVCLALGYHAGSRKIKVQIGDFGLTRRFADEKFAINKLRTYSFYLCVFSTIIALYFEMQRLAYALANGYVSLYYSYENSSIAIRALIMSRSCLFIALATNPPIKLAKKLLLFSAVIPFIKLIEGGRSEFVMIMMFIFFYLYTDRENKLENKITYKKMKYIFLVAFIIFCGMPFLYAWGFLRTDRSYEMRNLLDGAISFMTEQSGTFNLVGYAVRYEGKLPGINYTFGPFIDRILGNNYASFTVEAAMNTNQFGTVMTYLTKTYNYLNLYDGIGTSYVAELLYDFGYIGVMAGNLIIGYILYKLTRFKANSMFFQAIYFIFFYYFFNLPRMNILNPIQQLVSATNISIFIILFGISKKRGGTQGYGTIGEKT
ncbi:O-antigen polysaccharide polymerase Wzy [Lachnospiraceae bacterium WCA-9-b2]|uniref:O-antigen polysaccharide polymerase Wzy n=1 Tax=Sporofaciens musculi TaxID=2681861 RepID=A0A7X3ME95_9FIRM|nr:O-antigen polysaccharide polymerase Wzy family protein [Sporofaciens musculi]MXP74783.1 O-antigen polysaccharide polymerase Wzy [Sporofaciens musculi]